MDVREQVEAMLKESERYQHVENHRYAASFCRDVLACLGKDEQFDKLVEQQLSFSVRQCHPEP